MLLFPNRLLKSQIYSNPMTGHYLFEACLDLFDLISTERLGNVVIPLPSWRESDLLVCAHLQWEGA